MRDALEKEGLYDAENILFLLGIHFQDLHPDIKEYISTFKNANLLSRLYCEVRNGKVKLKNGILFDSDFNKLLSLLNDNYINNMGHINRPLKYSIKLSSKEAKEAFMYLQIAFPELDLVKLAKATSQYYEQTEYPKGFSKFLEEDGPIILMNESTD